MQPRKIAFIRPGSSPANDRFIGVMETTFPDFQVDIIDVLHMKHLFDPLNVLTAVAYGIKLRHLRDPEKMKKRLTQTAYNFNRIKDTVRQHLSQGTYAFSLQIQSMFDASVPGIPHFVYTDHTQLANLEYPSFDASSIDRRWIERETTIYRNACINFVRSTNIQRSMIEKYGCSPEQVAIVYAGSNAGIDPDKQVNPEKYHSKNILFVGVDWERKGGPELVAAFQKVLQVHPDAHLYIVGCSPRISMPNCHIIGRVPLAEVRSYYDRSAVFCLPTRREPFGIVFIEAFSNRLPIVATDLGAIPDFVIHGESGYRVDPINNSNQLANALIDLIGNPDKCRRFGERGYQIALHRYTWEHTGCLIRQYIEQALSTKHVAQK